MTGATPYYGEGFLKQIAWLFYVRRWDTTTIAIQLKCEESLVYNNLGRAREIHIQRQAAS